MALFCKDSSIYFFRKKPLRLLACTPLYKLHQSYQDVGYIEVQHSNGSKRLWCRIPITTKIIAPGRILLSSEYKPKVIQKPVELVDVAIICTPAIIILAIRSQALMSRYQSESSLIFRRVFPICIHYSVSRILAMFL